jgi:hypothetical protein
LTAGLLILFLYRTEKEKNGTIRIKTLGRKKNRGREAEEEKRAKHERKKEKRKTPSVKGI